MRREIRVDGVASEPRLFLKLFPLNQAVSQEGCAEKIFPGMNKPQIQEKARTVSSNSSGKV